MKDQREGGFLIAKIHQITNRIFKQMLKEYGIKELNPGQGRYIICTLAGGWMSQSVNCQKKLN